MTEYSPNLAEPAVSHDAHAHDTAVAHHFHDADQQHDAATLGMWTFLATEVLFFGGLILAYIVYRTLPHTHRSFVIGSHHLKEAAGAINTAVLLCSSLTMALAVRAAQLKDAKAITRWVLITVVLGTAFLGVKAYEYTAEFNEHLVPGFNFNAANFAAEQKIPYDVARGVGLFMCLYFFMTALHATHMVAGIVVMLYIARAAHKGRFNSNANFVEMSGLYWHFVDIVWIFLFPLLYLIR